MDFAEYSSKGFANRGNGCSHQGNQKLLEDSKEELNDSEEGSDEPDVEDGDDGEDDAPEDGERDGDDGTHNLVDPDLGVGEEDEGELPDGVETMGGKRLSQNVIEIKINFAVDGV